MPETLVAFRESPRKDEKTGRFLSGNSGGGRPRGARNKLGEEFLADLASWQERGRAVIDEVIAKRPHEYLKVVASLLARQVEIREDPFDALSDDELVAVIAYVQSQLAKAESTEPKEMTH